MRGKALSFFGMGYVGLTSALCFASKGFRVVCFDVDAQRAELIASGRAPFYEPRVEELLKEALESELLTVARDPARGGRGEEKGGIRLRGLRRCL